jgi:hypothetical protein
MDQKSPCTTSLTASPMIACGGPRRGPKRASRHAGCTCQTSQIHIPLTSCRGNVALFQWQRKSCQDARTTRWSGGIRTCDPRTAGISAHFSVVLLPTAVGVLLQHPRRMRTACRAASGLNFDVHSPPRLPVVEPAPGGVSNPLPKSLGHPFRSLLCQIVPPRTARRAARRPQPGTGLALIEA